MQAVPALERTRVFLGHAAQPGIKRRGLNHDGQAPAKITGGCGEPMNTNKKCRACGLRRASRRGGLCPPCFADPALRIRFPPLAKNDGVGAGLWKVPGPPSAIQALAGSEGKIARLCERAAMGVSLWHPKDGLKDLN